MRPPSLLSAALLLAALACPIRVAAQRDCCFGATSPPILDGARLAAGSPEEARERTERLGFTWSDPPRDTPGPIGLVRFRRGGLEWVPGATREYAGLSSWAVEPAVAKRWYLICYPTPAFESRWSDPHAAHPNSAIGVVGVIGLVGDLDGVAHRLRGEDDRSFGREVFQRDLGARSRESELETGGFLRLLAPAAADAPCAAWMSAGAGRWIGVVIECESVVAAAAWMDEHRVAYRWVSRHEDALQVGPEETGGVLFEFVQRGWRPRA